MDVLTKMDVKDFSVEILSEDESWTLFKEKVGDCVHNHPHLIPIAEKVAKECQGVPIALVTMGAALKGEEDIAIWKDTLSQIEKSASSELNESVYNRLRLSVDFLKEEEERLLFQLCSVFPEDFRIHHEDLTVYSMGLDLLKDVDTFEEARNRVRRIVKKLQSRFLLMKGDNEYEVKMHDLIRDVAIFIAKEERLLGNLVRSNREDDGNCKWISHFTTSTEEPTLNNINKFSSLCLLIMQRQASLVSDEMMEIRDFSFLEGMQGLKVLSFKLISTKSLEGAIQFVKNLRILRLDFSKDLKTLSSVGGLLKLEVLSCRGCREIEEVPKEIGGLTCLKLLDLSHCRNLVKIAGGVISKLVDLEELKLWNSFKEWESSKVCKEENKRNNASLKELESLEKLRWLEITIKD